MSEIKKLRKEAYKIVLKNAHKINTNSFGGFKDLAQNGHETKIKAMLQAIENWGKYQANHLDVGIVDDEPGLLEVNKPKKLTLKDVVVSHKKVVEARPKKVVAPPKLTTLYLSGEAMLNLTNRIGERGRKEATVWGNFPYEFQVKVIVPESKKDDKGFINGKIMEELSTSGEILFQGSADYGFMSVKYVRSYKTIDEKDFDKIMLKPVEDYLMNAATFAKLDIHGLVDYNFKQDECVLGAIKHVYPIFDDNYLLSVFEAGRKKRLTEETDLFAVGDDKDEDHVYIDNEIHLKSTDGFSANDLLFLAKKHDFSLYALDWHQEVFLKYISQHRNPIRYNGQTCKNRPFVFVLKNQHCYLIDDDQEINRITHENATRSNCSTTLFRQEATKKQTPFEMNLPIYENIPVEEIPNREDSIIIYSQNTIKKELLTLYKLFKVQLSTENMKLSGNKMIYAYLEMYNIHMYADVNYDENTDVSYKDVWELCLKLKIPFNNQAVQNIMLEKERMFINEKLKRVELAEKTKQQLLDECENKCENCKKVLVKGEYEFHHIDPRVNGGSNNEDNIQVLCVSCHYDITQRQKDNGSYIRSNPSESSFNHEVRDIFHSDLARTHAFIEKFDHKLTKKHKKTRKIDHNKMRRNLVIFNKFKYPVFTVMDQVEKFTPYQDKIDCGMYYVETNNYFPLRGNGWYMYNMVQFCLDNVIIDEEKIIYKLIPSLTLPADYFKEFFEEVVATFGPKLNKLGPNAFIGCLNKRGYDITKLSMTTSKDEAVYEFYHNKGTHPEFDKETNLWMIYNRTHKEFSESRAPIHKMILEAEIIEMYRLYLEIKKIGGIPTYTNTDCITAKFKDTRKAWKLIENTYWDDEKTVKKYKFEHKENSVLVERCARLQHAEKYFKNNREWTVIPDPINNDFSELIKTILESNKSWLVNGPAGCGKSTFIKQLMKQIKKYLALAPTNKACRIIGGQTIHKFLATAYHNATSLSHALHGVTHIFIDEISMVCEQFYKVFLTIKHQYPSIKFIVAGDFRQLLPVADRIGSDYDYEHSPAIHELCDGNRIQFYKCRRSDATIFNMCKEENIGNVKWSDFNHKFCMRHICFTNMKRIQLNKDCMAKYIQMKQDEVRNMSRKDNKLPQSIKCEKYEGDIHGQTVFLMEGMPVIARMNNRKLDIANNETFNIKSVDSKECKLIPDGTDKEVIVPTELFTKYFHIGFAITCHRAQGATFDFEYSINEWNSFDERMKYVAISRATKKEYINTL